MAQSHPNHPDIGAETSASPLKPALLSRHTRFWGEWANSFEILRKTYTSVAKRSLWAWFIALPADSLHTTLVEQWFRPEGALTPGLVQGLGCFCGTGVCRTGIPDPMTQHASQAGRRTNSNNISTFPPPIGSRHTCLSRYDPAKPRLDHHQQPSHLPIGYRRPDLDQRPFCGVISIKPPQSYSACSPSAALLQCDLYQPLPTTARSLSAAISAHRRISHPAAPSLSANRSVPTPCGVIFINHRQNFHISSTHPPISSRHTCLSRYDPAKPRLDHHQQPSHMPIGLRAARSRSAAFLRCDLYQPPQN